jgi:adenosylhomocysteine nucleosidase
LLKKIIIVAAMESELAFLRKAMEAPERRKKNSVEGRLGSKSALLLRSGVGPERTIRCLERVGSPGGFDCVLSIGCAGALSPALNIGDVVIPEKIIDGADGGSSYAACGELANTARNLCRELDLPFNSGSTVSAAEVAATAEAKRALAEKHGAVAVDMETAQVAAWAGKFGVPLLVFRTISDTSQDRIAPELGTILDHNGRPVPGKAAALFARKPGLLIEAARLKKGMDRSMKVLEKVITAFLEKT